MQRPIDNPPSLLQNHIDQMQGQLSEVRDLDIILAAIANRTFGPCQPINRAGDVKSRDKSSATLPEMELLFLDIVSALISLRETINRFITL